MQTKITIIGMNDYAELINDDLFGELDLPEELDREIVINTILMKSADLPLVYPSYEFLKKQIGAWSRRKKPIFQKWVWLLSQEYNPLYNYDRFEEYTDTESKSGTFSTSTSEEASGEASSESVSGDVDKATSYDSNDLRVTNSRDSSAGNSTNNSTNSSSESSSESADERELKHSAHLFGNIGVTTSTAMLSESWDWYNRDIPELIAAEFKCDFCLGLY